MKLVEQLRFAKKCLKYSYQVKVNLICGAIMGLLGLVYEIANINNGMGAYLMMLVSVYPTSLLYQLCSSQLIESSPCRKSMMTAVPTVLMLCMNMVSYLLLIGIEGIRIMVVGTPQAAEQSTLVILSCGIILVILDLYAAFGQKYYVLSLILMAGSLVSFFGLCGMYGHGDALLRKLFPLSVPAAIIVGLCLAFLGSLLQYGAYLLVYKKPMSPFVLNSILRQRA